MVKKCSCTSFKLVVCARKDIGAAPTRAGPPSPGLRLARSPRAHAPPRPRPAVRAPARRRPRAAAPARAGVPVQPPRRPLPGGRRRAATAPVRPGPPVAWRLQMRRPRRSLAAPCACQGAIFIAQGLDSRASHCPRAPMPPWPPGPAQPFSAPPGCARLGPSWLGPSAPQSRRVRCRTVYSRPFSTTRPTGWSHLPAGPTYRTQPAGWVPALWQRPGWAGPGGAPCCAWPGPAAPQNRLFAPPKRKGAPGSEGKTGSSRPPPLRPPPLPAPQPPRPAPLGGLARPVPEQREIAGPSRAGPTALRPLDACPVRRARQP